MIYNWIRLENRIFIALPLGLTWCSAQVMAARGCISARHMYANAALDLYIHMNVWFYGYKYLVILECLF